MISQSGNDFNHHESLANLNTSQHLKPCDTQAILKQQEFGLILAYSRFSRNSPSPRHKWSGIPGNSLGLPPRYLGEGILISIQMKESTNFLTVVSYGWLVCCHACWLDTSFLGQIMIWVGWHFYTSCLYNRCQCWFFAFPSPLLRYCNWAR